MHEIVAWVGVVGMVVGFVLFAYRAATRRRAGTGVYFGLMVAVTAVAAVAYLLLAIGLGHVTVGGDRSVPWVRFAQWLVVSPLVVVALGRLGGGTRRTVAGLVGIDVLAVLVSLSGALVTTSVAGLGLERTRLALWGVGGVLWLGVLVVLVRILGPQAGRQPTDVAVRFSMLRNLVVVVWVVYYLVWLVSPTWLDVAGGPGTAVAFLVVDLAATVGVGLVLLGDVGVLERA